MLPMHMAGWGWGEREESVFRTGILLLVPIMLNYVKNLNLVWENVNLKSEDVLGGVSILGHLTTRGGGGSKIAIIN